LYSVCVGGVGYRIWVWDVKGKGREEDAKKEKLAKRRGDGLSVTFCKKGDKKITRCYTKDRALYCCDDAGISCFEICLLRYVELLSLICVEITNPRFSHCKNLLLLCLDSCSCVSTAESPSLISANT